MIHAANGESGDRASAIFSNFSNFFTPMRKCGGKFIDFLAVQDYIRSVQAGMAGVVWSV